MTWPILGTLLLYILDAATWLFAAGFGLAAVLSCIMTVVCVRKREDIPFGLFMLLCGLLAAVICVFLCVLGLRLVQ